MSRGSLIDDFKGAAVLQISDRVIFAKVSQRMPVSQHSLYAGKKKFSKAPRPGRDDQTSQTSGNARSGRVPDERAINENSTAYLAKDA